MKNSRKFTAMVAALALAACSVAPMAAFAAQTKIESGSITIDNAESDHSYTAYQIFNGDLSNDDNGTTDVTTDDTITFANVEWGSGMKADISGIYADLMNLGITDATGANVFTKKNAENTAVALETAAEVQEALSKVNSNMPGVETFTDIDSIARVFQKYVNPTSDKAVNIAYSETNKKYNAKIADPGYYIVIDKTDATLATGEAYSKYILQVAGDVTVSPKADAPSVIKKVYEDSKASHAEKTNFAGNANFDLGNGFNDVADYSIGEEFAFELFGSLPSSFANYDGYYYKFTDTMSEGISLVDDSFAVKVIDGTTEVVLNANANTGYVYTPTDDGFTIAINDLKKIDMDANTDGIQVMSKDAIIKVTYNAKLNNKAVVGNNGNPNEVFLTYSNDSNTAHGGDTDKTGNTPKDTNVVFTYEIDVTKYLGKKNADGTNTADASEGTRAGFYLKNGTKFAKFETVDGVLTNKFEKWVDTQVEATEVFTKAGGKFEFSGLQEGTYTLVENTVPTGYNKMSDLTLVLTAKTSNENAGSVQNYKEADDMQEGNALTEISLKVGENTPVNGNVANGIVDMEVENLKGSGLPSTGGMGTTLFYLVGGVLVAGAGVTLITKKRVSKNNK